MHLDDEAALDKREPGPLASLENGLDEYQELLQQAHERLVPVLVPNTEPPKGNMLIPDLTPVAETVLGSLVVRLHQLNREAARLFRRVQL